MEMVECYQIEKNVSMMTVKLGIRDTTCDKMMNFVRGKESYVVGSV